MNKILHVTSNLKLGTDLHTKGSVIELDEATLESITNLVEDGTLRVVDGAENLEQAADIVAAEEAKKRAEEIEAGIKAETPNTWGPTKEPVVAPEAENEAETAETAKGGETAEATPKTPTDETAATTTAKFEVVKDFEVTNPDSKNFGKHVVGDIIEADVEAAQSLVDGGILAQVAPETGDNL